MPVTTDSLIDNPQAETLGDILVETRGVAGVFEVGTDGFLLHALHSGVTDPEAIAAATAVATRAGEQIGKGLNLGSLSWILLEFRQGKMIIINFQGTIWVVVGTLHMVFGDILLKIRNMTEK